jgi:ABC-type transport system involved in multi-copper enzyme maturation permease subunit
MFINNMEKLWILARETLILLRRDKVMVPALLGSLLISGFANLASDWSVEDFQKILFDIGYFGFSVTGALIAIFWGTKVLSDSRQEGSMEVHLAAPINRSTWILGKFTGLKLCLFLVLCGFLVLWQALMLLNDFGWMTASQILLFLFMYVGWMVCGALGMAFATAAGQTTALFCTLCLWVCGLSSASISQTLSSETPESTRLIVQVIARVWNLGQFSLIDSVVGTAPLDLRDLGLRLAYGVLLILLFLTIACLVIRKRDLVAAS